MLIYSLLVESVDLGRLGGPAGGNDLRSDRFDRCKFVPGEKSLGPLTRKGARDSAADAASSSVDHGNFVAQHHRGTPFSVRQLTLACRSPESGDRALLVAGAALPHYFSQLVMLHFLNIREVGLHQRKEALEVWLLAKALQMPLLRDPLDAQDVSFRLLGAVRQFVTQAVRRGLQILLRALVGLLECLLAILADSVTCVLDDHFQLLLFSLLACATLSIAFKL